MESPAVEAVTIAAKVRGHHHASMALNWGVPHFFVTDSVVPKALFCPSTNFDCTVIVSSNKSVALFTIDFLDIIRV